MSNSGWMEGDKLATCRIYASKCGAKLASMQTSSLHERGDMPRWSYRKERHSLWKMVKVFPLEFLLFPFFDDNLLILSWEFANFGLICIFISIHFNPSKVSIHYFKACSPFLYYLYLWCIILYTGILQSTFGPNSDREMGLFKCCTMGSSSCRLSWTSSKTCQ